ncbi:hypothetical protein QR680_012002 [Steinernema hermaphroditum]|uniref:Uncharacterized protein n=1 Tax=Steinernema hermaphroditum TaxID=289476 RepID=A0AA39I2F2_9BILA|nr:hypothetical protein QR680_012002 [Steinernema hermaphroditum]
MGKEADFYTLEELELLAEVATRGTMEGRKVPKITRHSAERYRRHLLDQLKDEAEEVHQRALDVLEEINETVTTLAAPVFPLLTIAGYILGHSNEYPYSSEDDEEERLERIAEENDIMGIEDDSAEMITIESDDEDTQRGQSAETTTPTVNFQHGLWQLCHKLRAADLNDEQHGRLFETERKFFESARSHLDRYFPPDAKLQQQADDEAST